MKKINKKKGVVFWITGLSGSGKTSIAKKIKKSIDKKFGKSILFSGDDIRKISNFNSYKVKDRLSYALSYAKLVKNISNQNINVIIATVSLFNKVHLWNRRNLENYCEIYIVSKTKDILANRKKKIYFKTKKDLVGIDIKPELPINPDIKIKNNFKKSINYLSKILIKKINLLFGN
jgi:adenylylsulfate kinase-like enzyme